MNRKKTKSIFVGSVKIGENAPIVVQSMTTTNTENINDTIKQINTLTKVGYEIISQKIKYLLYLGVTEVGTLWQSSIKLSIGMYRNISKKRHWRYNKSFYNRKFYSRNMFSIWNIKVSWY